MTRPPRPRCVAGLPAATLYKPAGIPARELQRVELTVDELEALRLVDAEGLSHEDAARCMEVSRQTVGRILESGRRKVAAALVGGHAIQIRGGAVRLACEDGSAPGIACCQKSTPRRTPQEEPHD